MSIKLNGLRLAQSFACVSVLALTVALDGYQSQTMAACTGISSGTPTVNPTGSAGDDTIICTGGDNISGNIDGLGGTDTITIDGDFLGGGFYVFGGTDGGLTVNLLSGSAGWLIEGGAHADAINLLGGTVSYVYARGGNDVITLDGATVLGQLEGHDGDDTITILSGSVAGNVMGYADNDTIEMSGGSIAFHILAGDGKDILTVSGGSVGWSVRGDAGDDIITINGGIVGSVAPAGHGNVYGGDGADTINVGGGTITGSVYGNDGVDTFNISGGTITGSVWGNDGADIFNISGGAAITHVWGNDGADTFNIDGGHVTGDIQLGLGEDDFNMTDGTVDGTIYGSADNETYDIEGGSIGNVQAWWGDDIITISGGTIHGGVYGHDGNDTITMTDGDYVGWIDGGNDNDTINFSGGTLGWDIWGGNGDDIVNISGGSIGRWIDTGSGDDEVNISAGTMAIVDLGGDNDTFFMDGGSITDYLYLNSGTNNVTINGGTINFIYGGEYDTIVMNGGTITQGTYGNSAITFDFTMNGGLAESYIQGGDYDDALTLNGGTIVGPIYGWLGNDTITITGGSVNFIDAWYGDDHIIWTGGTITGETAIGTVAEDLGHQYGNLDGGPGADYIEIFGVNAGGTADYSMLTRGVTGEINGVDDGAFDQLDLNGVTGLAPEISQFELVNVQNNSAFDLGNADRAFAGIDSLVIDASSSMFITAGAATDIFQAGNLTNHGAISLSDGEANDTLGVGGDYAAASSLSLDAILAGSGSDADVFSVFGNVGGTTDVTITNVGGAGGLTGSNDGDGILVVHANGSGASSFALASDVQAGGFFYDLNQAANGDWYLQTVGLQGGAQSAASAPTAAMGSWQNSGGGQGRGRGKGRNNNSRQLAQLDTDVPINIGSFGEGSTVWASGIFATSEVAPSTNAPGGLDHDSTTIGGQMGFHSQWDTNTSGGIFGGYTETDIAMDASDGSVDVGTFSFGAYANRDVQGFTLGAEGKINILDIDISAPSTGTDVNSGGMMAGIDFTVSQRIDLGQYTEADVFVRGGFVHSMIDGYRDGGVAVEFDDTTVTNVAVGLTVMHDLTRTGSRVFFGGEVGNNHTLDGHSVTHVGATEVTSHVDGAYGEFSVGAMGELSSSTSLFIEATGHYDRHTEGADIMVGVRFSF